jgi:dihydroorotase
MRRALAYARGFGKVLIQHPEEARLAEGGQMNEGEIAVRLGLSGISRAAEIIMLERDLRLVELTGARYHAAHLSTAEGVDLIRAAKRQGLPVTCDVAPAYFALTEVDVGDYRTFAKLSPPLRTDFDRRALIAGVADGAIDAIASDHMPQDQDAKRVPGAAAAPGVVGLETLLPVALELYHKGAIGLIDLLTRLTVAPAAILGLPLGRLRAGAAADLVIFDLDRPWVIDAAEFRSKSKNSLFDRRPVSGKVVMTVVDGRIVHQA